jgi:AraC-like DNA-binding protein
MSTESNHLASGSGWYVDDIVCGAGPRDRPFEEQHQNSCIAAVVDGTFRYRNGLGAALMTPGALLLGEAGQAFECSHDHSCGDRCLSFHFAPEFLESVVRGVKGARSLRFKSPRLAPAQHWLPLFARLETARRMADGVALEDLAVELAGRVYDAQIEQGSSARLPTARDERRIVAALRCMEASPQRDGRLADLASEAAMSPYHFLRVFQQVIGMSPRQYLLRCRLQRAAVQLNTMPDTVSDIALDNGFNDLSSFERMFKRHFGQSPRRYRRRLPSNTRA